MSQDPNSNSSSQSNSNTDEYLDQPMSPEEMQSALFANLVLQQVNMALIFLGQVPNPDTNEATVDLDSARIFIDTLEMLAARTQGNLTSDENQMLQSHLTNLRMAFVQVVEQHGGSMETQNEGGAEVGGAAPVPPVPPGTSQAPAASPAAPESPLADDPSRKKFVKRY